MSRLGMTLCLRVLIWRDVNGTRTLCVSTGVSALHVSMHECAGTISTLGMVPLAGFGSG